jgi:hypothetical protein
MGNAFYTSVLTYWWTPPKTLDDIIDEFEIMEMTVTRRKKISLEPTGNEEWKRSRERSVV